MGINESSDCQQCGKQHIEYPIQYKPTVYHFNSERQKPVWTPNVNINISDRGAPNEYESSGHFNPQMMSRSLPEQETNIYQSTKLHSRRALEYEKIKHQGVRVDAEVPRISGKVEALKKLGAGHANPGKTVEQLIWNEGVVQTHSQTAVNQQTSAVQVDNKYGPGAYQKYSGNENRETNVYSKSQSQLIEYSGYLQDDTYKVINHNGYNQVPKNSLSSSPQNNNAMILPVNFHNNSNTPMSTKLAGVIVSREYLNLAEEKRKLALKNLLIRPIIIMKGTAWNETEWMDVNAPHSFTSASINFLRIIELTKDKKIASEIKKFLSSDLLTPRYTANYDHAENGRKLNHFHVFWNMMHQLPFAVKTWDKETVDSLKSFYNFWVTATLQCEYCRGHYKVWIEKHPPAVTDLVSLNQWMFRLHNDVNERSSKPKFQWQNYNQRWGPPDDYHSNPRKLENLRTRTPQKNWNLIDTSLQERSSWRDGSKPSSLHLRSLSYRSPSPSTKNPNSRSNSGGWVDHHGASTPNEPVQPRHLAVKSNVSHPRNCLSKRKLRRRRKKVIKQKRISARRKRVSRRRR